MNDPAELDNTPRPEGSASGLMQEEVADYSGTAEPMLPVAEASVVQLQPGPSPSNLAVLSSDKVGVLGLHHHAASVGVVVMKSDYFGFMWWDGEEDCRINGELAKRTMIYTQGDQDGFHARGGPRQTMGITVRRRELIETLAALRGIGPEDVRLDRSALQLTPEGATRFRSQLGAILKSTIGPHHESTPNRAIADPGEAIFGLLVDAYLNSPPDQQRTDRPRRPEWIVRQAEERFFAAKGAPVSLPDLCAATGVSQTTLYRAFATVCGEPPLAYFHKRRLTDARRKLLRSTAYRGAVKQTALAVGLSEFGRFSVEYRELFGEPPSATLRRTPSF